MQLPGPLQHAPIRRKLVVLMVFSAGFSLALVTPVWIFMSWTSARAIALNDLQTTAQVIGNNSTAALTFGDNAAAAEILSALTAKPAVASACLYRSDAERIALFASYPGASRCAPQPPPPGGTANALTVEVPVALAGDRIGLLVVSQDLAGIYAALGKQTLVIAAAITVIFALSLLIAFRMHHTITAPILRLTDAVRRISETKDYRQRVTVVGDDELGQLSADFNNMLEQIARANDELQQARAALAEEVSDKSAANTELENVLDHLRKTQGQLIQSEKMASLGALVAGIAHEINTPVGIGVTAASTLQARAQQLKQLYDSGGLKRSDLERFIGLAAESSDIILNNLRRGADLIQSFKRVAADQSSNERRVFKLAQYIGEVLQSLTPKFRHQGHSVTVDCPIDLQLDSYPGVLAQIITNFVSNSLLHAFPDGQAGHIAIDVKTEDDDVIMRCSDDGVGIGAAELPRIFDPFFTTKRGAGGTGLGLNIVYNLVVNTLKGTITAESEPGRGVTLITRFPRVVPESTT